MNINHVTVVGRVTADPELRTTTGGQPIITVGIATNRIWTDKNKQKQEDVEFHNVVIFGRQAEIASQFAKKGHLLGIEGRLRTRLWADKGGTEHKTTEIICEQLHLGPGSSSGKAAAKPVPEQGKDDVRIVPEEQHLSGDEHDTGRILKPLFGGEGEIKTEEIPF